MARYHINANGDSGVCRAKKAACPFGDSEDHYDSADEARAAFEKANSETYWRPTRKAYLKKLELRAVMTSSDVVVVNLEDDGDKLTTFQFRVLPGKRIWPLWRYNPYDENRPTPKGVHTELQERVERLLPGWSLTSNPYELSPQGEAFRERYLEAHPNVDWSLDKSLESDESMETATPNITREQFAEEITGTPLAKLLRL